MDSMDLGNLVENTGKKENIVLYDWLSVTTKKFNPEQLAAALGLVSVPWQETKGAKGYRDRKYFSCISIHYNGRQDMGIWLEMSGQGCRTFETLSNLGWPGLFKLISEHEMHITRLDVAYDDHTGILDIARLARDTLEQEYISKSDWWETDFSSVGTSVYIGSPKSSFRIRIYDKAAERKKFGEHWIRVEMQLRDDRAVNFMQLNMPVGAAFVGVLVNYLRYVDSSGDSNKWRWPMKDYWRNLVEDVERISIYRSPGMEYNEERVRNFVVNQAGNAIDACLRMYGIDEFQRLIANRESRPNPKYDMVVNQYWEQHGYKSPSFEGKYVEDVSAIRVFDREMMDKQSAKSGMKTDLPGQPTLFPLDE